MKNDLLTEGRWIDAAILLVLTKRLITPLTKMDAYKFGIIDRKGKKIRDPAPDKDKEKDAYSLLNRLIIKVKRLLGNVGLAALGAFLVFLKEENQKTTSEISKQELMESIEREQNMENFDLKYKALFETHGIDIEEFHAWKLCQFQKEHLKK